MMKYIISSTDSRMGDDAVTLISGCDIDIDIEPTREQSANHCVYQIVSHVKLAIKEQRTLWDKFRLRIALLAPDTFARALLSERLSLSSSSSSSNPREPVISINSAVRLMKVLNRLRKGAYENA